MNLHLNSDPSAASKNPETGQVPYSVGLYENCLGQTTCRRSNRKQDVTKQSWLPKHQAASALEESNDALCPYYRNCWQNIFPCIFKPNFSLNKTVVKITYCTSTCAWRASMPTKALYLWNWFSDPSLGQEKNMKSQIQFLHLSMFSPSEVLFCISN